MAEFKNASDALNELESLICDNARAADLANHIYYNDGEREQLGWTLDRLQTDAHKLRTTFYLWFELKREESGLARAGTGGAHV